jgi:hypothetical protein
MHEEWDTVCGMFFQGRVDGGCNQGKFALKDGRTFVSFNTAYGDGNYTDQHGRQYPVDAGLIGCIRLEDIDTSNPDNHLSGQIVEFDTKFMCTNDHGTLLFGNVVIETNDPDGEEEDYDCDWYDEE